MTRIEYILFIVLLIFPYTFSQQCRSYNRQMGNCVSIKLCPPLLQVLKNNPTPVQLRQLQRLTCGFVQSDPKVCCPINSIITPSITTTSTEKASTVTNTLVDGRTRDTNDLSQHPAFNKLPSIYDCGIGVGQDRIIGGKNASQGAYPFMARIGYRNPNNDRIDYYCGGTIISKRYILTAAHCTFGIEDEYAPVQIRVGEHDTLSDPDCSQELSQCSYVQDYRIEKLLPHKDYSSNSKQNDISLIRVDRDIDFNTLFIKPICLPFMNEYDLEKFPQEEGMGKAIVAGWGRTQWNKAEGSKILQEVTLPLKTNEQCQTVYNRRVTITRKQLCSGGEVGKDSCGGDSGGPLMVTALAKRFPRIFQIGVVSFGPVQCGVGGLPGVYARTTGYLKWLLDTISESE